MKRFALFAFTWVCRLGLAGLFLYSAWWKIDDPALFEEQVAAYGIMPQYFTGLFALTLPMVEALSALMVLATPWRREGALAMFLMLSVFIAALTYAAAKGLHISCGCFGEGEAEGTAGLVKTILRDIALLIPSGFLAFKD